MNSMYMTFCSFDTFWGNCMSLEHDILVWTFENIDIKYENYCIEKVLWNFNMKPESVIVDNLEN